MAAGPAKAAASSRSELENLRNQITCPIWFTVFKDPKILPCHHTCCKQCLGDMAHSAQCLANTATTCITCPACRKEVSPQEMMSTACNLLSWSINSKRLWRGWKEILPEKKIRHRHQVHPPLPGHIAPMPSSSICHIYIHPS